MPRIKFRKKKEQVDFFIQIQNYSGLNWSSLAKRLGIHKRTLFDWRQGRFTISEKAFKKCLKLAEEISIPKYKVLLDFWSVEKAARKGGLAIAKKYGNPGTPVGRRKGGVVSQLRRRLYPKLYKHCNLRKNILKPRNTPELAEFFGIVLGDGGITDGQVTITLNKENDRGYIYFVCSLIKKLFGLTPAVYRYRSPRCKKVVGVTISSTALIEFLLSKGLKKGNKVKQQIGVPNWIRNKTELSKSCLRGLIDTDGGVYYHRHKSHGCQCFNIGLQLTNKSVPILTFAKEILQSIGFTPKPNKKYVNLYREEEVCRYAKKVGFNNTYHSERLKQFSKMKYGRSAPNW